MSAFRYKTQGEAERFISDKARIASVLNSLKKLSILYCYEPVLTILIWLRFRFNLLVTKNCETNYFPTNYLFP